MSPTREGPSAQDPGRSDARGPPDAAGVGIAVLVMLLVGLLGKVGAREANAQPHPA